MARPKVPRISRPSALRVALEIVDREGLAALSIRRLAAALGVNGTSLYHHFRSKDEIVDGLADLVLSQLSGPEAGRDWHEWLPESARELREVLVAHPALIPVLADRRSTHERARLLNAAAARMIDEGVPLGVVMPLLDALELFTIGSARHETHSGPAGQAGKPGQYPALARAMSERGLSTGRVFDLVTASILEAMDRAVEQERARWSPPPAQIVEVSAE